jgi:hypothetical protein
MFQLVFLLVPLLVPQLELPQGLIPQGQRPPQLQESPLELAVHLLGSHQELHHFLLEILLEPLHLEQIQMLQFHQPVWLQLLVILEFLQELDSPLLHYSPL